MSEFKASGFRDEFGSGGPDLVGITTFTSPYYFVPPSGSTAERPSDPPPGMLRFNTDIGRLEVWRNDHWATILGESPNLGNHLVTNSAAGTGTRALTGGGYSAPSQQDHIDYLTISTLGNAQDFGNLNSSRYAMTGLADSTRGIVAGGTPVPTNMEFVTIASTGNGTSFGTIASHGEFSIGLANRTRGIVAGGTTVDTISYVTIASTGDSQDFGNLTLARRRPTACASSVRGIVAGGQTTNVIDYLTISTTGDSLDFGDCMSTVLTAGGCSNSVRGIFAGGTRSGSFTQASSEFITIASTGNGQEFGDLTLARRAMGAASSSTRAVFMGGYDSPNNYNRVDYMEIMTAGNAIDFGDLNESFNSGKFGFSNGHGGL
mgnify:FL=1